jgi:hypothetical protein
MPVRSTMSDLIAAVRDLLPEGTCTSAWSDEQIQRALDEHKTYVRFHPLRAAETVSPTGRVEWVDFFSRLTHWEGGAVLQKSDGGLLLEVTDYTADLMTGHWTMNESVPETVYVSGQSHCIWGAAADLLEIKATAKAGHYDFSTDNSKFSRSQEGAALREQAKLYRRKQRSATVKMTRGDVR